MQKTKKILFILTLLLGIGLIIAACAPEVVTQTVEVPVEVEKEVVVTEVVTVEVPVEAEMPEDTSPEIPFEVDWASSGHADETAEAFRHWDEDDPPVVPTACAKCHVETGFHDFLGYDGSEAGVVNEDHPPGVGVTCVTCHNDVTLTKTSVVMPSGVEITGLGNEATCMECHQGRQSKFSVDESIEAAGVDDDTVSEDLGFQNIHYYPAAATKYGTIAKGGYEYDGQTYESLFRHVVGFETCAECHNTHTLELKVEACAACHEGVETAEDFRDVRMAGSLKDFNGNGDIEEGVYYELEGLRAMLGEAIVNYGNEVTGTPIGYTSAAYPYFFIDTNADGEIGEDEAAFPNRYNAWTPRLLRAAYNYQMATKDTGAYAHGGKYIIALLYDSIADLNTVLATPVDLSTAVRNDAGHFAGSEEAFRHWDEDEPAEVPARCSKCHTAEGLPLFHKDNTTITQEPSNGFQCSTCHNDVVEFTLYEFEDVTFPSGAVINSENVNTNLCMNCHQGRTSKFTVDAAIEGKPADTVDPDLRFLNIHYFAAGATRYGTEAKGGYEFDGNSYVGFFEHVPNAVQCTDCHSAHGLTVNVESCSACHTNVSGPEDLMNIRIDTTDWDGDGDTTTGVDTEIANLRAILLAAMQEYANNTPGMDPIIYDPSAYPYFFIDTDGSGSPDPGEGIYPNRYVTWTPRLLQSAYNYQYASKDPGSYAHNGKYVIQLLYDAIENIGGDTSGLTRPQ